MSRAPRGSMRTVHEISAGGLVVDGLTDADRTPLAVVLGHTGRRGRMMWSLPKGHIEPGERAEQTAIREIAEETGVRAHVVAALGTIGYWFNAGDRRVHKTVHHYLLGFDEGEFYTADHEVGAIAWVPLPDLPGRLAHADERRLAAVAADLIAVLRAHGAAALPPLPPSAPLRRRQTHSRAGRVAQ